MGNNGNSVIVRTVFEEIINGRQLDRLDEVLAPTYVNHDMPMPVPGPEGMRQVLGMFFAAFPDMRVELHQTVEQGDLVCSRGTMHGTHQGEFNGIPATGRTIAMDYMDIWRLEDGKGVENWVRLDMMSMMQQLGVIPG